MDIALRRQQAFVDDRTRDVDGGLAVDKHGAGVGDCALRGYHGVTAGAQAAAVAQPTVGLQYQVPRRGADAAGIAHAHAGFGADQGDLAGVHAAQRRRVQREGGRRPGSSDRRDAGLRRIDPVGACHHFQLVGRDLTMDLDGPRQNAGVVGLPRVQAGSVDADHPALHHKAVEVAARDDGRTGGDGGPAGVDKPGAVNVHAGRVGDDDLGAGARHF